MCRNHRAPSAPSPTPSATATGRSPSWGRDAFHGINLSRLRRGMAWLCMVLNGPTSQRRGASLHRRSAAPTDADRPKPAALEPVEKPTPARGPTPTKDDAVSRIRVTTARGRPSMVSRCCSSPCLLSCGLCMVYCEGKATVIGLLQDQQFVVCHGDLFGDIVSRNG